METYPVPDRFKKPIKLFTIQYPKKNIMEKFTLNRPEDLPNVIEYFGDENETLLRQTVKVYPCVIVSSMGIDGLYDFVCVTQKDLR